MRTLFLLLLFALIPTRIISQSTALDSLSMAAARDLQNGDFQSALIRYERLIPMAKTSEDQELIFMFLQLASRCAFQIEDLPKALHYAEEMMPVFESLPVALKENRFEIRVWLAQLYQLNFKFSESLREWKKIKAQLEGLSMTDSAEFELTLNSLGELYFKMNDFVQAEMYIGKTLAIAEVLYGSAHPIYAVRLNNLATVYFSMGRLKKASELLNQALISLKNKGEENTPNYTTILGNLGELYRKSGDYQKALPVYEEALTLAEKNLGVDSPAYAVVLNNTGLFYADLDQIQKAEEFYIQALEILRTKPAEKEKYAAFLNNLGQLYEKAYRLDEALLLMEESRNLTEELYSKNSPEYAKRLNNLVWILIQKKEFGQALPLALEAEKTLESLIGSDNVDYLSVYNNLLLVYFGLNEKEKLWSGLEVLLHETPQVFGEEHPALVTILINAANLYETMGATQRANELYQVGLEKLRHRIHRFFSFMTEIEKQNFIDESEITFSISKSFYTQKRNEIAGATGTAYDLELLTKGLILESGIDLNHRIQTAADADLIWEFEQLRSLKVILGQEYSKPLALRSADLKNLEKEAEYRESKLNRQVFLKTAIQPTGKITWQDVQKQLKKNQVAIEFSHFHFHNGKTWTDTLQYAALLLRKGDPQPVLIPLFTQRQFDDLVKVSGKDPNLLYRGSEARSTEKDYTRLYELLWKPLEEYLSEGETIYFAPSGSLHQIAFAAIKTPEGNYLSDRYHLVQLNTTAALLKKEKPLVLHDIALFGGIDYDADEVALAANLKTETKDRFASRSLTSDLKRGESWNYLSGTLAEVQDIQSLAKKQSVSVQYFTGNNALEEDFKALDGKASPTVLHIATHGFFFPDPEKTKEELNRLGMMQDQQNNVFKLSDNPLNRAGLLFAGANRAWSGAQISGSLEDGILTAYEASQIYLPNTQLAVLSACETGLGEIKGSEGVFGLQRAFKGAGAEYLLMSLWQVPDRETAEFMDLFYTDLFKTKDIELSFKQTQKKMRTKYPDEPYKWAAFVLVR